MQRADAALGEIAEAVGGNVPRQDTANVWPKALSPMPIPVDLVYLGFYTVPALGGQDGDPFIWQTTSLNPAWARYGCLPRRPYLFGCAAGHLPPIPNRGPDPVRTAVPAPNALSGRFCGVQGA